MSAARPLVIGITSYARAGEVPSFSIPAGYVDAVRAAGGVPLVLPPGEPHPERLLDLVDAVILAGGGDISPAAYGGEAHETVYHVSEERDRFEFDLTRALLASDVPGLFICRGLQMLNVVCGGTLHAHLPDRYGDQVSHRRPPRETTRHPVHVDPGSHLGRILGASEIDASSWHHQAIDRVGEKLRPVAWADDGVIEAVEYEDRPWCIGVQWHPEMQIGEAHSERLFGDFLSAARGR